jgi:hypothetical protein
MCKCSLKGRMNSADNRNLRKLIPERREDLQRWAQSRTLPAGAVFRARFILALADGTSGVPFLGHAPRGQRGGRSQRRAPVAALTTWPRDGVSQNPKAWLLTTARHTFVDLLRHRQGAVATEPTLLLLREEANEVILSPEFPDAASFPGSKSKRTLFSIHPVARKLSPTFSTAEDSLSSITSCSARSGMKAAPVAH